MNHLPLDNLSYPLRIEIGDFQATGFLINQDGDTYLVSTTHTYYYDDEKLISDTFKVFAYTDNINDNLCWQFTININTLIKNGNFISHNEEDVTVIYFSRILDGLIAKPIEGIMIDYYQKDKVCTIPSRSIANINQVNISSEAYVLGYPSAIGLVEIPQIDFEKPLVKRGSIAGINFDKKTIILDCEIYHGNSGGPVLQGYQVGIGSYKIELIGMVVEYVPIEQQLESEAISDGKTLINSGYSIAISADIIQELIKQIPR